MGGDDGRGTTSLPASREVAVHPDSVQSAISNTPAPTGGIPAVPGGGTTSQPVLGAPSQKGGAPEEPPAAAGGGDPSGRGRILGRAGSGEGAPAYRQWEQVEGGGRSPPLEASAAAEAGPSSESSERSGRVPMLEAEVQQLRRQLQAAMQEVRSLKGGYRKGSLSVSPSRGKGGAHRLAEGPLHMWRDAWEGFGRGFSLAYACRAGLALMLHTQLLARQRQWADMRGWQLLSEKKLVYREDAVRLGLFIGGFTGVYQLLYAAMARPQGVPAAASPTNGKPAPDGRACFVAGTVAGLVLLAQKRDRRRTIALYAAARLAQCWYNSQRSKGRWHFWGSDWNYGDALLFAIGSAQVMYAYVMRPETLPAPFWKFIVRSGPVPAPVLEAVRRNLRALPIDVAALNQFLASKGSRVFLSNPYPRQIPIGVLNPGRSTLMGSAGHAAASTFRKTFPLYVSLTLVPSVVFNLARAVKAPLTTGAHSLASAVRSTAFLSAFVGLYQATVSVHRTLFEGDSKYLYWFAGLVASTAILIERKSRRAELALYVAPRAVDSVLWTLLHNRLVPSIPFGETALFALSMGGLMYYRVCEPETMAPFLKALISRIVFGKQSREVADRQAKEAFIKFRNADFPGTVSSDSSYEDLQGEVGSPTSSFEDVQMSPEQGVEGAQGRGAGVRRATTPATRRRSTSRCSFEQVALPEVEENSPEPDPSTSS